MKRRVCERDPSHIEEQECTIEGHDHVYGDWVVTTPATCEEEGVMTRYCNICLEPDPQTQTIPAHGHDYKLTAMTPATCTEDGSKTYTCSHDASHTYSETIPKTGHNYGEWIVTTPATTSAPGVETRYCANDPTHTETRPIPQLPNTTTVTINVNIFNHSGYGTEYYRSNYSTKIDTYTIGSVLDITWTYSNPHSAPSAWYKLNATRATSGNYYTISGARNNVTPDVPKQDGLVSTYNFRTTVTKNLVIDICLDNSWIDNLPNVSVVSTEPNRASFAPRTLMKAGSSLRASRNGAAVLTQEQLATLLASYKTPEQVW